jgi:hypothetical protein
MCAAIIGVLGARKKPVSPANRIGTIEAYPVKAVTSRILLIIVRVTQAFTAAIQQTIAKPRFWPGYNLKRIMPNVTPIKNIGIIKPPLQPELTVKVILKIFTKMISIKIPRDHEPFKRSISSK